MQICTHGGKEDLPVREIPSLLPSLSPCFLPSFLASFLVSLLPAFFPCFFPSLLASFLLSLLPSFSPCFLPSRCLVFLSVDSRGTRIRLTITSLRRFPDNGSLVPVCYPPLELLRLCRRGHFLHTLITSPSSGAVTMMHLSRVYLARTSVCVFVCTPGTATAWTCVWQIPASQNLDDPWGLGRSQCSE